MATKKITRIACGGRALYIPAANDQSQYISSSRNNVFGATSSQHYWRLKDTIKITSSGGSTWVSSNTYPNAIIKFYIKGSESGLARINFEINCDRDINTNPNWNNTAYANFIKSSGHNFSCIGDNKFKGDIYFYTEITAYGSAHLGPAASEGSGYSVQITYEDVSETIVTNPSTSTIPLGTLNPPSVTSPTDGSILNNNSSVVNNAKVTFTFKHPYITQSNGVNANVNTRAYLDIYDFSIDSWFGDRIWSNNSYNSNVTESLTTTTLTYGHNYLVYVGIKITGDNSQAATAIRFSLMQHPTVTAGTFITKAQMDLLRKYKNYTPDEVSQYSKILAVDGRTYSSATINNTTKINASWYNNA